MNRHTGLYQYGCTSDGLRGFSCTQRQRDRFRARIGWLNLPKFPWDYPCYKITIKTGLWPCSPTKPLSWQPPVQVPVPQMCTKHQPSQAPRPPDRVHEVKGMMQRPYTTSRDNCVVMSRLLRADLEPVAFPSKQKVCLKLFGVRF